ncbi:MAG: hypothetical protein OEV93_03465 [Candidatus Moranbacteria bacterium]|nr:hypothetical protein [Candidatus Moranbacteria bacterium]
MKNYAFQDLPQEMQEIILELNKSTSKKECLKKAYDAMISRYRGHRWATITHLSNLFDYDPESLWNKKILICTNINHLMKILLINSKFFEEKDVEKKWTLIWFFSPHQYLRVHLENPGHINVDVWGKAYGVKFGEYSHGFKH